MAHRTSFAYHPGITMHKLLVGGNLMGAVFVIAVVLLILFRVPLALWFLLGAAVLGAIMSVFIIRWHGRHKIEIDDLSALVASTDKTPKV
jgi:hypothetical protein